jgi:hypothetical protein
MFPFDNNNSKEGGEGGGGDDNNDDNNNGNNNSSNNNGNNDDGGGGNNNANNNPPPPWSGLKGRVARAFLKFLEEHGEFRSGLEEAAARAAAAEANSLWARDRLKKKKLLKNKTKMRRRRLARRAGGGGEDGEDDVEEYEEYEVDDDDHDDYDYDHESLDEVGAPPRVHPTSSPPLPPPRLPDDPYEQMQYYFHALRSRLSSDAHRRRESLQASIQSLLHDEIHHPHRVPMASGTILLVVIAMHLMRIRLGRMKHDVRAHSVLGKKFDPVEYVEKREVEMEGGGGGGGGGGKEQKKKKKKKKNWGRF